MATVTFSNPEYKDKTVYAVAGSHTQTLLKLALENKVPIQFNCEEGDCGTCLIRVSSLDKKPRMGGSLTDKERTVLLELKKITKEELEAAYVGDHPPQWRLACQMIVRDEDILVEY